MHPVIQLLFPRENIVVWDKTVMSLYLKNINLKNITNILCHFKGPVIFLIGNFVVIMTNNNDPKESFFS